MPKLSRRDIDAAAWDVFAGNQLPDSHLVLRTSKTEGANQSLKSAHRYTPQPLDWDFDLVLESSHRVHAEWLGRTRFADVRENGTLRNGIWYDPTATTGLRH